MKVIETTLPGVCVIEPQVFGDNRGWFMETYTQNKLLPQGIDVTFVQDNHSFSAQKWTLRGLHFQNEPKAQTKLVRCTRGSILDVAVDLRKGSPNFGKWVAEELSEENKKQIFIPKGFAHAFLALTENVEVQYKVDEYYAKDCDRAIRYDDPSININWGEITPVLSEKDKTAPYLADSDINFEYQE